VKKALPLLFGTMLGLTVILTTIGLGLGVVFVTLPGLYQILKYLGFAYILFLGYSIIRSGYKPIDGDSKLFGLFEAAFSNL
jgi:threonine/homoserine/homoserine lactone efflux protein